jgi:hypothetical protein
MFRRVILPVLVGLLLLGAGIAIGASAHDWGHHQDTVVVSGGGDGTAGQTIVVTNPHGAYPGFFFFPFGLLFVGFTIFLIFGIFRRRRWGGGGGCGRGPDDPNRPSGPEQTVRM